MSKGYMYILLCSDGSYYTGSTKNLELSLVQHQSGEGANHTKKRLPVKLVYYEEFESIAMAFYREKQVQRWSRKKKEDLIENRPEDLPLLSKNYTQYYEVVSTGLTTLGENVREGKGYAELDFAKIDTNREQRTGQPEVIFGKGKTPEQIVAIMKRMLEAGNNILATKISKEKAERIRAEIPKVFYNPQARTLRYMQQETELTQTYIAIVSAGTADLPVVEEAYETALFLGNRVEKVMDVGVAGIHRLFDKLDVIRKARVVIVVAGMEGALASVIAGLVDKPVIAVPTSVGYGANLNGIATLLSMINSCTTLSVVNIDNGFGAASQAGRINRL